MDVVKLPPLGRQIKEARVKLGLSREALSARVSVSAKSIQRYEEGQQIPRIKTLKRLGHILDIPLENFFHDDQPSEPTLGEIATGQREIAARLEQLAESIEKLTSLVERLSYEP